MRNLACLAVIHILVAALPAVAQEKVFSGPQVGEKLVPFSVRAALAENAGQTIDFVTQAGGKPLVLVFVHVVNRPALGLTRILTNYTASRAKDGLQTGVVWLSDDATEAENTLKRVGHALAKDAPTGVSLDGGEGPGSYGLNRNIELTILVAKEGKVTANFALVQPSLQVDLPKILEEVVKVAGGKVPKLEDLEGMTMRVAANSDADLDTIARSLLSPLIKRTASKEDVEKAAQAVKAAMDKNPAVKKDIGRRAKIIVTGGKLSNYGTEHAQEYLKKWAAEFGNP